MSCPEGTWTVEQAAEYLNAQVPEYGGSWTADRVRGVIAVPRYPGFVTPGRINPAPGEAPPGPVNPCSKSSTPLVNCVTHDSVVQYAKLLRAPFDGVIG